MSKESAVQFQMNLEYSSFQLYRFFHNTCLNPGTRLQPTQVDSMVHVKAEQLTGEKINPFISEIPVSVESISWVIKNKKLLPSYHIKNPQLCFVEIYSLEKGQVTYPDESYWGQYFDTTNNIVAPNGTLFVVSDELEKISIDLKKEGKNLIFGYGVIFTVEVDGKTNYCRIDPIANIRSSDPGDEQIG